MSRSKRWLVVMIAVVFSIAVGTLPAHAFCYDDPHSSYQFIGGSAVCAYTGGGCTWCFSQHTRSENSWDLCYYDWLSSDLTCTYYM